MSQTVNGVRLQVLHASARACIAVSMLSHRLFGWQAGTSRTTIEQDNVYGNKAVYDRDRTV
jgi:hypothetical protein